MSGDSNLPHKRARPLLLLDTSVISARARKHPPAGLREWLSEVTLCAKLCIAFPVLVELRRGLNLCPTEEMASRIRAVIDELEEADFVYFGLEHRSEQVYADLLSTPALKQFWQPHQKAHHQHVSHDLMIAAIAVSFRVPIITTDNDFKMIAQYVELPGAYNPLSGEWIVAPPEPIELPPLRSGLDTPFYP